MLNKQNIRIDSDVDSDKDIKMKNERKINDGIKGKIIFYYQLKGLIKTI